MHLQSDTGGVFVVYFQAPLHRQRHPQEDDPVSGWPLLQDAEDQDPPHGWTRSRVASQRNDQGLTLALTLRPSASSVCLSPARPENAFVTTGTKKGWMRPVVYKRHSRLHKDITWRAYIMRSHSGRWNGNSVSMSGVGAGCVSTVNPNKHCW